MRKLSGFVKNKSKLLLAIVVSLVVGGSTAGVVMAAIPDTSGVIHACYRTNNGSVRIIDSPSATCGSGEVALNWNQTGPQGPAGTPGTPGTSLKLAVGNQVLGSVVETYPNPAYFDETLQRKVEVMPFTATTAVLGTPTLFDTTYFTSNDCTGTPYMPIFTDSMNEKNQFYNQVYTLGYDKHYIVAYNEPLVQFTPQSRYLYTRASDPQQDTLVCQSASNTFLAVPLTSVTLPINTPITDPVRYTTN